MNNTICDWI